RDYVVTLLEQRLPHGEEVTDRGLGGRGELGIVAQALVEGVEARHLELAFRFPLPAHVQADLVDAFARRQLSRQVMGAVCGDCDGGHPPRDATATPRRAPPTRTSR